MPLELLRPPGPQPPARVHLQQLPDESLAGCAHGGLRGEPEPPGHDALEGGVPGAALEGRCAVQQLVGQHPQAPPVHPAAMAVAVDHLGGQVLFGADEGVGAAHGLLARPRPPRHPGLRREPPAGPAGGRPAVSLSRRFGLARGHHPQVGLAAEGQVEVRQPDVALLGQEQVLGLYVAVDNAVEVQVLQRQDRLRHPELHEVLRQLMLALSLQQ
mmetsp:Transcript_2246/g.6220  ORF Transcript_2246/g.6220 Transcript_2246/m.6220 type:complete len:214 (+) Transcript_2246:580-1221(+)